MRRALILAVIILTLPEPLLAGTSGKIRGRVTDRATGEALAGANVAVGHSWGPLRESTASTSLSMYRRASMKSG